MKVAIMQPYLFPYIGYWQLISAVDIFVIYDDVNFIKQGYINRNYIFQNGQKQLFTLEVIGGSSNKFINQIKVGRNSKKILKTIAQNYNKAPYFKDIFPVFDDILNQREENLAEFIGNSLKTIAAYLGIDTKFIYSSDIKKDNSLKAQERVIDICKHLNATNYINAIGGQELYNKNKFLEENIVLNFLDSEMLEYKQFKNEFVPYLSIIDIMMFNTRTDIQKMLDSYKLI